MIKKNPNRKFGVEDDLLHEKEDSDNDFDDSWDELEQWWWCFDARKS